MEKRFIILFNNFHKTETRLRVPVGTVVHDVAGDVNVTDTIIAIQFAAQDDPFFRRNWRRACKKLCGMDNCSCKIADTIQYG